MGCGVFQYLDKYIITMGNILVGRTSDTSPRNYTLGDNTFVTFDKLLVINHWMVSRPHCGLIQSPEGYGIVDLGSRNGTSVNGRRWETLDKRMLRKNEEIEIPGIFKLRFLGMYCYLEEYRKRENHLFLVNDKDSPLELIH